MTLLLYMHEILLHSRYYSIPRRARQGRNFEQISHARPGDLDDVNGNGDEWEIPLWTGDEIHSCFDNQNRDNKMSPVDNETRTASDLYPRSSTLYRVLRIASTLRYSRRGGGLVHALTQ